jgi:hypothetical protein
VKIDIPVGGHFRRKMKKEKRKTKKVKKQLQIALNFKKLFLFINI